MWSEMAKADKAAVKKETFAVEFILRSTVGFQPINMNSNGIFKGTKMKVSRFKINPLFFAAHDDSGPVPPNLPVLAQLLHYQIGDHT